VTWSKPADIVVDAAPPAPRVEPVEGFDEAHQALLDDRAIQFTMNQVERPPTGEPWRGWDLSGFFELLAWAAVAIIVAAVIYFIVRYATGLNLRRREREAGASLEETWRPADAPSRALLAEADALAERGDYAGAAHLLLYRSIEDIEERRPDQVRPALTSRDIARLPALPPSPAQAFGGIVRAVERSLFGRRPLGAEEWRECRAAYERFAFAQEWRA
jgi:hypothetical protein